MPVPQSVSSGGPCRAYPLEPIYFGASVEPVAGFARGHNETRQAWYGPV